MHPLRDLFFCSRGHLYTFCSVVWRMAKQLGYSLAKGNMGAARDVMRMSLPVDLFEPRSVLQVIQNISGPTALCTSPFFHPAVVLCRD